MENYAVLLRNREMEKIAELYTENDIVFSGHGLNKHIPYDSIRAMYVKQPRTPLYFEWGEMKIDLLSEDAALITSAIAWYETTMPDTVRISYTGLFTRTPAGWRIRHEHESESCR